MQNWIFGCDVCQQACPWNKFSLPADISFNPNNAKLSPVDLTLSPAEFNRRFKHSPIQRAKRRGLLRNLAVALGNSGDKNNLSILEQAAQDDEPLVKAHAQWAIENIKGSS